MADYLTTDTELTSIANAIRTKGGTSDPLTYPAGFVSAINAIPTGGGPSGWTDFSGDVVYQSYNTFASVTISNLVALYKDGVVVLSMTIADEDGIAGTIYVPEEEYPPQYPDDTYAFFSADGVYNSGDVYSNYNGFWIDTYGSTNALVFVSYQTA